MKKSFAVFLLMLTMVELGGCGGVPPTYYYRIDYPIENDATNSTVLPVTIGVAQFGSDALYEGDRIVYRQSPYEVQYYHYRRWIAPPRKIVTEKVLKQYQASGAFKQVVRLPARVEVDYILRGQIRAFEEWDESKTWYGIVSLDFRLQRAGSNEIVWEKTISEKTMAAKREPVEVVKAISESLNKVISSSIQQVKQQLKQANI
ncbi:MAG: hypothetical protein D6743_16775 [Calditrichaeota bacterium]|nr:MAG: hypothetical protein D6743_16775 [Calditrichota bacterium]